MKGIFVHVGEMFNCPITITTMILEASDFAVCDEIGIGTEKGRVRECVLFEEFV